MQYMYAFLKRLSRMVLKRGNTLIFFHCLYILPLLSPCPIKVQFSCVLNRCAYIHQDSF